jgi:hypothetical protein
MYVCVCVYLCMPMYVVMLISIHPNLEHSIHSLSISTTHSLSPLHTHTHTHTHTAGVGLPDLRVGRQPRHQHLLPAGKKTVFKLGLNSISLCHMSYTYSGFNHHNHHNHLLPAGTA